MERFTKYHNGKAILNDENKLQEAIQKMAKMEDIEERIVKHMGEAIPSQNVARKK